MTDLERMVALPIGPPSRFTSKDLAFLSSKGIQLSLNLGTGPRGRGLFFNSSPPLSTDERGAVFLRIPAEVCLSPSPSSSFGTLSRYSLPPPLLNALDDPGASWELRTAVLLAHCTLDPSAPFQHADLYRWYRPFLPPAEEQTSVLFFSPEELCLLRQADPLLASTAEKWQARVEEYYRRHLRGSGTRLGLDSFRWAVGCVESRTFSACAPGQRDDVQAFVPVLDFANHKPHAPCFHDLAVGPEGEDGLPGSLDAAAFELRSTAWNAESPPEPGSEALLTYGNDKSNRVLLEQYGFSLRGNPFDRIQFSAPQDPSVRLRRETVLRAFCLDSDFGDPPGAGVHPAKKAAAIAAADIYGLGAAIPSDGQWTSLLGAEDRARIRASSASILEAYGWGNLNERRALCAEGELAALCEAEEQLRNVLDLLPAVASEGRTSPSPGSSAQGGGGAGTAGTASPRLRSLQEYIEERRRVVEAALKVVHVLRAALVTVPF